MRYLKSESKEIKIDQLTKEKMGIFLISSTNIFEYITTAWDASETFQLNGFLR